MKSITLLFTLVLAILVAGCRPDRMQSIPRRSHTVTFAQAGVSLVVGEDWQCREPLVEHSVRPPTLTNEAGIIRILLLPPDRSEPALIADGLRADFDDGKDVARHSFRKEQFVSNSGARGWCVSYLQLTKVNGRESYAQNAHFLLKNRAGRCVAIHYVAVDDKAPAYAVCQMLRAGITM